MNPNNCETCDHKKHPDGGHCYMFRTEPDEVCMIHTLRKTVIIGRPSMLSMVLAAALADAPLIDDIVHDGESPDG